MASNIPATGLHKAGSKVSLIDRSQRKGRVKTARGKLPSRSVAGQKRKCLGSRCTSILPSGADIVSLPRHVRLVPNCDIAPLIPWLFDYLVGPSEDHWGQSDAKRTRGLEVDHQFEFRWLLDGQVTRLCAFENLVDMPCGSTE
jgi:hypothetical protein